MKTASIETHGAVSSSRRNFLKLTATAAIGGGLMLGFGLSARSEIRDSLTTDAPFAPNAFLRIDRSGKVTIVMPFIEMGQGTYTSIPMLIAEELEVDVDKVAIEHSPPDDKIYVNPLIGVQMTGGSTAIRSSYVRLRSAGATARVMLVSAAAQRWNVDPSTCHAQKGVVAHGPTGRKLGYGKLVDAAAKLPVPEKVALKEPADFKLIGTPHRRLDTSGKVDGSAKFGIDSRPPGMKFAVVAISPTFGGKLVSVDEAKAKAVPGVSQVVRLDDAVAIVAIHTWAAKQGLAAAVPQWDAGPNAKLSTADIVAQLAAASEKPGAVARHDGDAAAAIAHAAQKVDAVYEQPFLAHATMEPMNCTVQITKDACDIWVGTQIPGLTQAAVMKVTGLKREQVRIHNHLLGGGFGRRLEFDGTVRAVQIAQQVEGPVQVIWTREEDIQHDMYRPYYYDRMSAGARRTGQSGRLVASHYRLFDRRPLLPALAERRHRFRRGRERGESAVRVQRHSCRLGGAGTTTWNSDRILARRGCDARNLCGRELRRRARSPREAGSIGLSRRVARQESASKDRLADCRGEIRMGQAAAGRARPRDCALHRLRQLHRAGRSGQCRQGRSGQPDACLVCRRLRYSGQSRYDPRADGERYRLRAVRRAIWRDHHQGRPGRADQLRRLSRPAHQRSAAYRSDPCEEPGGAWGYRRTGYLVCDAGAD